MSAHTPGPWMVTTQDRTGERSRVCSQGPLAGDRLVVADCSHETTGCGNGEANARLIAAAPALLALLIELTDIEGPLPGNAEWARKVKAALAAAGAV